MNNNLDFGTTYGTMKPTTTSTKLTVYGTQGTIPLNPVRFPNAYLTAPIYDLSNNIVGPNGPKLNIYGSIFETRYPFTYIGTPAISNYGLFGQINQDINSPKISVYQQVQGTLVFSYDYTGLLTLAELASTTYLPIITGNALTIVNSYATKSETKITVTVNISYIDNGSDFGLSFYTTDNSKPTFYNSAGVTNLSITTLTNIPLSRSGSQFANLMYISTNFFASNTVVPTILPNTSLFRCFQNCTNFNSDISGWNVTNVTNMQALFNECTCFNQNIGSWDVTNVTIMYNMFQNCASFNQNIGSWDVTNVTNMSYMFQNATAFNQNIGSWNTTNVTNMASMFYNATAFDNPIVNWNLSQILTSQFYTLVGQLVFTFTCIATSAFITPNIPLITNTYFTMTPYTISPPLISGNVVTNTFYTVTCNTSYNSDTANTTDFGLSFVNCYSFYTTNTTNLLITILKNIPLSNKGSQFANLTNINTSSKTVVPTILPNTSLNKCFYLCANFNSDISNWDTSNVISMNNIFNGCRLFNNGDTSNVAQKPLTYFVTSTVNGPLTYMFNGCINFNQNISNWDTTNVTSMLSMFNSCTIFNNGDNGNNMTKALSWNTTQVTNMGNMFKDAANFNQNISNWDVNLVTNISSIFSNATIFNNGSQTMSWTWTTIPTITNAYNWHSGAGALTSTNAPKQLNNTTSYW